MAVIKTFRFLSLTDYYANHLPIFFLLVRTLLVLIVIGGITENLRPSFLEDGQYIAKTMNEEDIQPLDRPSYNQVMADITTTFTILIGIFFPSVTGKFCTLFS